MYQRPSQSLSMAINLLILTITISFCEIEAHREVIHPKGNSIIYDDRLTPLADNFDFKRLNQPIVNPAGTSNQSPIVNHENSATTNPNQPAASIIVQSESNNYPKLINEKIESVLLQNSPSSPSAIANRQQFYQQVIPKLTSIIFDQKPTHASAATSAPMLSNAGTEILRYRSPIIQRIVDSSPSQPVAPLWRPISSVKSIQEARQTIQSDASAPPTQTYMTLSFEDPVQQQPDNSLKRDSKSRPGRRSLPSHQMMATPKTMSYYQLNNEQPMSALPSTPAEKPSMTLSFQDANTSKKIQSTQSSDQSSSSADDKLNWRKSIAKYAKEFGFETPFGMESAAVNDAPINDNYSSQQFNAVNQGHQDRMVFSRQPSIGSTISLANDEESQPNTATASSSPMSRNTNEILSRYKFLQNDERYNSAIADNNQPMDQFEGYSFPSDLFASPNSTMGMGQQNDEQSMQSQMSNQSLKEEIDQLLKRFYEKQSAN